MSEDICSYHLRKTQEEACTGLLDNIMYKGLMMKVIQILVLSTVQQCETIPCDDTLNLITDLDMN